MALDHTRIEFRTFDSTLLRGDYYPAASPTAPIIIMTQGLSLLKEHFIDDFGRRFRAAGISVLIYDHRGWGSSEGTPRHEVNPLVQAADYHDAISYAISLQHSAGVKKPRVAIWGIGHSGGASTIAGNDPRLSAVVLTMPFNSGANDAKGFPKRLLERAWANREATAKLWTKDPQACPKMETVDLWATSEANARGEGPQNLLTGIDAYNFITEARTRSAAVGTPNTNQITLQSFWYIANVNPTDYISKIAPTPMLYLAATTDALSGTIEAHRASFEKAGEGKEWVTLGDHHIANYFGESFEKNIAAQIDFLKRKLL